MDRDGHEVRYVVDILLKLVVDPRNGMPSHSLYALSTSVLIVGWPAYYVCNGINAIEDKESFVR